MRHDLFKKHYDKIVIANEQFGWDDIIDTIKKEIEVFAKLNSKVGEHLGAIEALINTYEEGYTYMYDGDFDNGICFEMRSFAVQTLLKIMDIIRQQSILLVDSIPYDYKTVSGQKEILKYLGEPIFQDNLSFNGWLNMDNNKMAIDFAKSNGLHYMLISQYSDNGLESEKGYNEVARFNDIVVYKVD